MKLLLDTHALIGWFRDDPRLSATINQHLDDPSVDVVVSAATAWEMATKYRSGTLNEATAIVVDLPKLIQRCHFKPLGATVEHGHRAGLLPGDHKDPFDRMLAAQSIVDDMGLATADPALARLGARVVW